MKRRMKNCVPDSIVQSAPQAALLATAPLAAAQASTLLRDTITAIGGGPPTREPGAGPCAKWRFPQPHHSTIHLRTPIFVEGKRGTRVLETALLHSFFSRFG